MFNLKKYKFEPEYLEVFFKEWSDNWELVGKLKSQGIKDGVHFILGYSKDGKYVYTLKHGGLCSITLSIFRFDGFTK